VTLVLPIYPIKFSRQKGAPGWHGRKTPKSISAPPHFLGRQKISTKIYLKNPPSQGLSYKQLHHTALGDVFLKVLVNFNMTCVIGMKWRFAEF
jgi:hypothetical protein